MHRNNKLGIQLIAALITLMSPLVTNAQVAQYAAPNLQFPDSLGIEIVTGQLLRNDQFLSIGGRSSDAISWRYTGQDSLDPFTGNIEFLRSPAVSPGSQTRVKINNSVTNFVGDCTTSCLNASGTGATLVKTATNWLYTNNSGTVYTFSIYASSSAASLTQPIVVLGYLQSIQSADGSLLTLNSEYESPCSSQYSCRKRTVSIVSNRGFALKYDYNLPSDYWFVTKISAVNLNAHSCNATATICDAYDNFFTIERANVVSSISGTTYATLKFTDALNASAYYKSGIITSYVADPNIISGYSEMEGIYFYKSPTNEETVINRDMAGRVTDVKNALGTWTYVYRLSNQSIQTVPQAQKTGMREKSLFTPGGSLVETSFSHNTAEKVYWTKNALGNTTAYTILGGRVTLGVSTTTYDRLTAVQNPESDMVNYTYDPRGNVTAVTTTPKPGSGQTATAITANYDTSCLNLKICNQPTWTRDAKGNQTDYTYDAAHGGVLTVTLPTDQNGLRTRIYNTYTAYDTGNGYIYRLTRIETCGLAAGELGYTICPAATTTSVTTTDYGNSSTAPYTYKSSLPYQVTLTDGASSLSATTTYGYDVIGNVVWVDGPLAGSDDRTYKTYDANRRVLCEIGADPDGGGALFRAMVRHTYDAAGRELKTESGTGTSAASCLSNNMTVTSFTRNTYDAAGRPVQTEVVQP